MKTAQILKLKFKYGRVREYESVDGYGSGDGSGYGSGYGSCDGDC